MSLEDTIHHAVREAVAEAIREHDVAGPDGRPHSAVEWTWRERVWACPAETRLAVPAVCEALGRSESWLYKRTGPEADDPLPARKAHGQLVFTAGELRTWIREHEEVHHALPMTTTDSERRAFAVVRDVEAA